MIPCKAGSCNPFLLPPGLDSITDVHWDQPSCGKQLHTGHQHHSCHPLMLYSRGACPLPAQCPRCLLHSTGCHQTWLQLLLARVPGELSTLLGNCSLTCCSEAILPCRNEDDIPPGHCTCALCQPAQTYLTPLSTCWQDRSPCSPRAGDVQ